MAGYFEQLICKRLHLAKDLDGNFDADLAANLVASIKTEVASNPALQSVALPTDDTATIAAIMAGNCSGAGQAMASNVSTQPINTNDFNNNIGRTYADVGTGVGEMMEEKEPTLVEDISSYNSDNSIYYENLSESPRVTKDPFSEDELQKNSNFVELTTIMLRNQCNNIFPNDRSFQKCITAGNALEFAYEEWYGFKRNRFYEFKSGVRTQKVRPDFVQSVLGLVETTSTGGDKKIEAVSFPNGTFVEVKASGIKTFSKESFNRQLFAEIDALSKETSYDSQKWGIFNRLGVSPPKGLLSFVIVSTYGVTISQDLIEEATQRGIAIFISYAFQNTANNNVVFSTLKPLNPNVVKGLRGKFILGVTKSPQGVVLDWTRARPSWEYSNEYDESKKYNAYECN